MEKERGEEAPVFVPNDNGRGFERAKILQSERVG